MKNKIRIFTDKEMNEILNNPNVVDVINKSRIIYTNEFKYWAVLRKRFNPEKTSKEIFREAGFNTDVLSDRIPRSRLNEWTKKYEKFGKEYFNNNTEYYKTKNKKNNDICFQEIIILLDAEDE